MPNNIGAAISVNVVGTANDVWSELRCQGMPVHDGGTELAWREHLRIELEGPAVGGGHCCDYQLHWVQMV
jgi:hypothetical protein